MKNVLPHIAALCVLLTGVIPAISLAQTEYEAKPESEVIIKGSSTVHDFDCESAEIEGSATLNRSAVNDSVNTGSGYNIRIRFPVESFDCGRSRMNRDFYETLKAGQYQAITFDFISARPLDNPSTDRNKYLVEGNLNVAGTQRRIQVEVYGSREDNGSIRIRGMKPISMKDYDIDPPTALMGMIQVKDKLEVHFDLRVASHQQ